MNLQMIAVMPHMDEVLRQGEIFPIATTDI